MFFTQQMFVLINLLKAMKKKFKDKTMKKILTESYLG